MDNGPQSAVPFGKYLLLKRLAVGGMAELYLAKDTTVDQLVVIKRILPYLAQEAEFVQMFLDEARIASQLHHPNIIRLHELGKLEGSIFITMEFVQGVDMRKLLAEEQKAQGALPPAIAAWLTARLCEGLFYAHNKLGADGRPLGIIHRDVSPQNLMVGFTGDVKLVDFGIAKASAFMERSKPGVIKGKFLYLSPEQLTQDRVDHRADLFAVGTMLYEVTVGKSPFHKGSTEAVIFAIRAEDPPPPHVVKGNYPLELSRIIMRCLQKDRARRYQSAREIQADLDAWLRSQGRFGREEVRQYIARIYGAEEERTILFVPGVKLPAAPPPSRPAGPPILAEPTERERRLPPEPDETTRPLAQGAVAKAVSEGRRPTPLPHASTAWDSDEKTFTLPTQPNSRPGAQSDRTTVPERPSSGRRPSVAEAPLEPTAISQSGKVKDEALAEPTAISQAGRLKTGDSLVELTPSIPTAEVPPAAPLRKANNGREAVFEVPRRFARDEVPNLAAPTLPPGKVPAPTRAARKSRPSPSENSLGALLDEVLIPKPASSPRPPRAQEDDEDEVSTMDLRGAALPRFTPLPGEYESPRSGKLWLVLALVFLGAMVAVLVAMARSPPDSAPLPVAGAAVRGKPPLPPEHVVPPAPDPDPPPSAVEPDPPEPPSVATQSLTTVIFRGPAKTRVIRDGSGLKLNTPYHFPPGPLRLVYQCPRRGRVELPAITMTAQVREQSEQQDITFCR